MSDLKARDQPAHAEEHNKVLETIPLAERVKQQHADIYIEALEKYGQDGSIDAMAEKRLKRFVVV